MVGLWDFWLPSKVVVHPTNFRLPLRGEAEGWDAGGDGLKVRENASMTRTQLLIKVLPHPKSNLVGG